jgi:hypothetical protein
VVTTPQTQARQQIETLITRYRALDEATGKITSEVGVVHQFINPLLAALDWPALLTPPSANACATRSTRWWRIFTA